MNEKYGDQYVDGYVAELGTIGDVSCAKATGGITLREKYIERILPVMMNKLHNNNDVDLLAKRAVTFVDAVLEEMGK